MLASIHKPITNSIVRSRAFPHVFVCGFFFPRVSHGTRFSYQEKLFYHRRRWRDDAAGVPFAGMWRTCPSVIRLPGSYKSTLDTRDGATGWSLGETRFKAAPFCNACRERTVTGREAQQDRCTRGCSNDTWGPLSTRSHVWSLENVGRCPRLLHTLPSRNCAGPSVRDKTDSMRINVRRVSLPTVLIASLARFFLECFTVCVRII